MASAEPSPAPCSYRLSPPQIVQLGGANVVTMSLEATEGDIFSKTYMETLRQIHDEYVAKEEIKRGHEVRLAANPAAQLTDVPPVTDTELEHLNIRARGVMSGLSNELSLAQVRLTQPPKYQSSPSNNQDQTTIATQASTPMPFIPPVIPISPNTPSSATPPPRSRVRAWKGSSWAGR